MSEGVRFEDCIIVRRPGYNRLLHLPSNRCVLCREDDVTDQDLFSALIQDLEFLKDNGLDSKETMRAFHAEVH